MTDKAVVQGDYVDLRFVKSRKVAQVVLEIPIEAATQFVQTFGTPNPATGVPVAIARLMPTQGTNGVEHIQPTPEKPKGGKLAQLAGILCHEGAFSEFLHEKYGMRDDHTPEDYLRHLCGVSSRADLDHIPDAERRFRNIASEYKAWRHL